MARNVDSLSVQRQLNSLFEQRLNLETRVLDAMQQELKVALQLQTVLNGLSVDQLTERLDAGAAAMEKLADKASDTGDIGTEAMKKIAESSKLSAKETSFVGKQFTGVVNVMKSVITTAGGVANSMLKIGKAVLSIPLAIFKNLLNDAASFVGDTSFMEALEAIRKEFGSFKEDVSKNILGAYRTMTTELQQVTGLSVWRVFGTPAEQLKYLHDIASKAGAQMHQFGRELSASAGSIAAFDKGMGIGSENLRAFMNRATVLGTNLQSQLKDTANYALQMGQAFGMSSKTISRDVGVMMKDVKNFGSLTQKEMTVAAIYTRKLGLEIKDLTGLIGQFDNFDKAAESAALLSQAFGASVDAFKMMNEQDPAKRLDDLRRAMAATGKSTENMTRQELKLLAQTAGLSEEAAKLAFATKNQGLSYDEVQKQASKAENAQITQAEALKKLADNIERVVRAGGQMHGSFFKMFFAGMERGIKWSKEYMGTMISVRQALWETFWAGDKVGRAFAASENVGFGKFMKNFGATFSPANVRRIMYGFKDATGQGVRGVVAEFNDVISGKQSFGTAVEHIRTTFHKAIDQKTLHAMLDGGKQAMRFLAKGIGSGTAFMVKELTSVFKTLTEFIRNPKNFIEKMKAAGREGKSFGGELISSFTESFGDPKVLKDFKDAFMGFAKVVMKKVKEVLTAPETLKIIGEVGGPLLMALFGPSLIRAIPMLMRPLAAPLMRGLLGASGGMLAGVAGVALAGAALVNVDKKMNEYERNIDQRFDKTSRKVGAYGGSLVQGLTLGLLPDNLTQLLSNTIAEFADKAFEAITTQMGGPFTAKLKSYFSSSIDFMGSIGGLIGAIFSGDDAKISAAAEKVGTNFVNLLSSAFDFLITEFPKLLVKLGSVLENIVGSLLSGFGKTLTSIGDKIPIVGGAVKGLGIVMMGLGEVFKDVAKFSDNLFNKLKNIDIGSTIGKAIDEIKLKFIDLGTSILGNTPGPILTFLGINDKARGEMMDRLVTLRGEITDNMRKMAEEATKAAQEAEQKARESAASAASSSSSLSAAAPSDVSIKALEDFNTKIQAPAAMAVSVTQDVTKSINELNNILGDGSSGAMKIGEKLQRFANNSGLGKNSSYEIKNKGINLKLDLKIVMDAGEVEKAIVLRKESILFDSLFDKNTALSDEHQASINQVNALKGGG